ncbi:hypothetical protein [Yoonia sp.]|uniref:hypothetical protein n=1 Tax=Yoonia sp. TaxID=2212373 RepID=UPI00238C2F20|nr:hypothetical protein [Yoonia sp.]MDE0851112.1 hypothetical protein [Yoonia sp.]
MSVRAAADQVHQALNQALVAGKLPASTTETAKALLNRLRQPVRVTLMGLPKSDKSTLVNLLLNDTVMPEGVCLPTTQYVRGETPSAVLTLTDGRRELLDGADPYEIAAAAPMFVEVALPLAALGRINVLEIVAPATMQDQQRAMHWAAKRTDIAIWCTESFDQSEQALWITMPDTIKDNGFLLLTHADMALARGDLEHTLQTIRANHAHQFSKIMQIATPIAISARQPDGTVDKPILQKSGGLTLILSILRQVDMSLQSTVDQAEIMVETYRNAATNPAQKRDLTPKVPDVAPVKPAVKAAVETAPVAQTLQQTKVVEMRTAKPMNMTEAQARIAPRPQAKSKLVAVESRTVPKLAPTSETAAPRKARPGFMPKARTTAIMPRATPETCDAYDKAITYLTKQGRILTQDLASAEGLTPTDLMNASADSIQWLSDFLEDLNIKNDPVLEKSRIRARDAAELVQLMHIEKNDNAALDALSLVIQLKRDLEAEISLSRHSSQNQAA